MPYKFLKFQNCTSRDSRFCEQEVEVALKDRVLVHTDMDLKQEAFEGKTWQQQCDHIILHYQKKFVFRLILMECILGIVQIQNSSSGGFSFEQAAYLF